MEDSVTIRRTVFPFSAIVGQETLKTALLVNAVDPRVGGVLIRGERGTAKSTTVRALAAVLPPIEVVAGCRFGCDPLLIDHLCDECRERLAQGPLEVTSRGPAVVDLPMSATEDRIVGTLDIEAALARGERRFEAGLLARANRGILYVDEVNLLDDHLVDTLLDSAAMGLNIVEREGITFSHPASFMLVGTMNPEEGEVRPQLLDRFGLCVDVCGLGDPVQRVAVLERRQEFESDSASFLAQWEPAQARLREQLAVARTLARTARVPRELLFLIAEVCERASVDGHRADLTIARGAAALAALAGRDVATDEDVRRIAPLALTHRVRKQPRELDAGQLSIESLMRVARLADAGESTEGEAAARSTSDGAAADAVDAGRTVAAGDARPDAETLASMEIAADAAMRASHGRRHESRTTDGRGRYVRAEAVADKPRDIAVDATVRAAAGRRATSGAGALDITPDDLRTKVRSRRVGASIVFCVDASGSMAAGARMEAAKVAVMGLLSDAYVRRDRVGLVAFRGDGAEVLLTPTSSVDLAKARLRSLPTGGATPLAAGIARSLELLAAEAKRYPTSILWLVLVTDGRANVASTGGSGAGEARAAAARVAEEGVHAILVDTSPAAASGAFAREIARAAGAEYVRLAAQDGTAVESAVRERITGAGPRHA
jgi:magnesium chelatase subunit D